MLHPSSLIRLAAFGSVAFLVRAIVREATEARHAAALLPPPGRAERTGDVVRRKGTHRARAGSRRTG